MRSGRVAEPRPWHCVENRNALEKECTGKNRFSQKDREGKLGPDSFGVCEILPSFPPLENRISMFRWKSGQGRHDHVTVYLPFYLRPYPIIANVRRK